MTAKKMTTRKMPAPPIYCEAGASCTFFLYAYVSCVLVGSGSRLVAEGNTSVFFSVMSVVSVVCSDRESPGHEKVDFISEAFSDTDSEFAGEVLTEVESLLIFNSVERRF